MRRRTFALAPLHLLILLIQSTLPAMTNENFIPGLAGRAHLQPVDFDTLEGWRRDNHRQAWDVFRGHCEAIAKGIAPLRSGIAANNDLRSACAKALTFAVPENSAQARAHFESLFAAYEIRPLAGKNPYDHGFLTGYYEPVVAGSFVQDGQFAEPVLGRPSDLVTLAPELTPQGFPADLASARRTPDGALEPYATRADIENLGAAGDAVPILYVRDGIELFMMQVQGSARIKLPNGRLLRLTYAGRNGQPYTSIGRLLVERGHVASADMSLARLKSWVRENGQKTGEAGRMLMQENKSYVFFRIDGTLDESSGPVGAASIPLMKLRSIAVDRNFWPYGLPMWIDAEIPWRNSGPENFRRLMIAQDTGSAILGAARADIFFGTGTRAGRLAGGIRHRARMFVLLPRDNGGAQ